MTYTIQNMNTGETIWSKQMAYGVMEEGVTEEGDQNFVSTGFLARAAW
ncbi:MAG: hypothetical protein KDD12_26845 [Lewinella sp.]|nr:hypothetical protein [Lewinella sp.]